jgi:hypothetical protein
LKGDIFAVKWHIAPMFYKSIQLLLSFMSFMNSKKVLLSSLSLVVGLCGVNVLGAIAGTFSIKEISAQIARKTSLPILLPPEQVVEQYKFDRSETIYAYVDSYSDGGYSVLFNNQAGNVGNAAFRFSVSAKRGKDFEKPLQHSDPRYATTLRQVKLSDNSNGLLTSWCGGIACWTKVQWKSKGVVYNVTAKQRQHETALAIANAAIRSGNRNP